MTRQSILFEKTVAKMMDTRVKPAYDAEYVAIAGSSPIKSGMTRQ
jgi:hypothetical protein